MTRTDPTGITRPTAVFLDVPGVIGAMRPASSWSDEVPVRVAADSFGGMRTTTEVMVSPQAVSELKAVLVDIDAAVFWLSEWAMDGRLSRFFAALPHPGLPQGAWVRPQRPRDGRNPQPEWKAVLIGQILRLLSPRTQFLWIDGEAERWRRRLRGAVQNRSLLIQPDDIAGIRRPDLAEIRRFHQEGIE